MNNKTTQDHVSNKDRPTHFSLCPLCLRGFHRSSREQGFTLIEIIVVLILVSILAAGAGFGMTQVARSFASARENARMAQVAQIALDRMCRSLSELDAVTTATGTAIAVTTPGGRLSIGRYGTVIRLDEDATPADGATLIDRVSAFQLTYTDSSGNLWTTAQPVDTLMEIGISLTLSRTDGIVLPALTTSVTPRNNGSLNAPR